MKNSFLHCWMTSVIFLISFPNVHFAQTPDLGTTAGYALFTAAGAVGNTGVSEINGNIGTNVGAITGFGPPTVVNGTIEEGTPATAQAALDVQVAYDELMAIPPTVTDHAAVFGNGETLFAGVYNITSAGSTADTLFLDGQGDSGAVFIFQFGGAFTTAAASTIILTNGTTASNVFWGANGAIAMAAITSMQGTLIAKDAISMAAAGILEGRMLSTAGAAAVDNVEITIPGFVLPVELITFSGSCIEHHVDLHWTTATEENNDYFAVERGLNGHDWQKIGTVNGVGNSSSQQNYMFTDMQPSPEASLYRLKQTDFNTNYHYSDIIAIEHCGRETGIVNVCPNPSSGHFQWFYSGDPDKINSIEIFDTIGQKVYGSADMTSSWLDISGLTKGVYAMKVQLDFKSIHVKVMVEK